MNAKQPRIVLLSLSIALALAACGGESPTPSGDAGSATDAGSPGLTLDESALPPVNRFQASDLDTTVNACHDFNAYANGSWLAANDIPGDRTSWGSFEMLTERTLAVQRQLAEQAAADDAASGVEKIVGDFWATGTDRAGIDAQGITPIQGVIDAIEALDTPESVADYLRASAADGHNVLFSFGASPDFKDSTVNIAYAAQGGLGLPDKTYYFDDAHADKLAAYEEHVARVLELSGIGAEDAAA
ncbi:MAG: peptidase, partial [Luteimonas sp.]